MHAPRLTLSDLFPPPAFLYMPAAGLDLADEKVRFVRLKRRKGNFMLEAYGEETIPKGLLVGGTVKEPERLRALLREFARKHDLRFVRATLPEEKVYLVTMRLPLVDGSELRTTITASLEEYVPLRPEETTFDYTILAPHAGLPEGMQDVLVGAMRTEDTLLYGSIFEETGMTPVSFEIEAQAVARASVAPQDRATRIIVDIGRVRTGVALARGGDVQAASTIEIGSQTLTDALVKHLQVKPAEAEQLKNTKSISVSAANREFVAAVLPTLSVLQDEIRDLFVFWSTKGMRNGTVAEAIQEVLLTGGGANLRGLTEYLADGLRVSIRVANPWENVASFEHYVPPISRNEALGYSAAIGLALGNTLYD